MVDMHWIAERRQVLGISQAELARRLQTMGQKRSTSAVGFWEQNHAKVPMEPSFVTALATALDWTVTELLIAAGHDIRIEDSDLLTLEQLVQFNNLSAKAKSAFRQMIAVALGAVSEIDDGSKALDDLDDKLNSIDTP